MPHQTCTERGSWIDFYPAQQHENRALSGSNLGYNSAPKSANCEFRPI